LGIVICNHVGVLGGPADNTRSKTGTQPSLYEGMSTSLDQIEWFRLSTYFHPFLIILKTFNAV